MSEKKTILLAGGDLRQARLANRFAQRTDYQVYTLGIDQGFLQQEITPLHSMEEYSQKAGMADFFIMPMPAMEDREYLNAPFPSSMEGKKWRTEELLKQLPSTAVVFAGKVTPHLQNLLERYNLTWYDYLNREELAALNAVATAEGTLQILMEELPVTIKNLSVLIIGSGRISKVLRRQLVSLGAKVTVSARKPSDLAWIGMESCTPIHIKELPEYADQFDAIINTVPAKILGEALLRKIPRETLLIDLASKPGGIDFDTANDLGLKTIWALSLPGKTAPITSGDIIYQTIQNIMEEWRETNGN